MSAIEQKIVDLFSPLPYSFKARIVALLSNILAEEVVNEESLLLEEDLNTSIEVRNAISEGKMNLLSEEEYWSKLKSK